MGDERISDGAPYDNEGEEGETLAILTVHPFDGNRPAHGELRVDTDTASPSTATLAIDQVSESLRGGGNSLQAGKLKPNPNAFLFHRLYLLFHLIVPFVKENLSLFISLSHLKPSSPLGLFHTISYFTFRTVVERVDLNFLKSSITNKYALLGEFKAYFGKMYFSHFSYIEFFYSHILFKVI